MQIRIKKGLDLPINGEPEQTISEGPALQHVAVLGKDYVDMKPTMHVQEGDRVKLGQPLFSDKKTEGVIITSPGSGIVEAINRGARRVLQSVVIRLEGDEAESFSRYDQSGLAQLGREQVRDNLTASGLWTAFRTRPYSKTPAPQSVPHSIFVTAMDSNPLSTNAEVVIAEYRDDFINGLTVISHLTDGKVFVCKAADSDVPVPPGSSFQLAAFSGPHPAGLVGTHIHFLDPVSAGKTVWHLGYQDVIAIGKLFTSGQLWTERVVALGGALLKKPRLVRTRPGADIQALLKDEIHDHTPARVISGSVLSGHHATGAMQYLGRYHNQISVLAEGIEREFMGWIAPGKNKFSLINVFVSSLQRHLKKFDFSTSQNGSPRAMVPIGNYEEIMPLDILPTQLLRALLVRDTDSAQQLGCLELDEEDLALCSFVCVGKYDYGPVLRLNLQQIEREG